MGNFRGKMAFGKYACIQENKLYTYKYQSLRLRIYSSQDLPGTTLRVVAFLKKNNSSSS